MELLKKSINLLATILLLFAFSKETLEREKQPHFYVQILSCTDNSITYRITNSSGEKIPLSYILSKYNITAERFYTDYILEREERAI